MTNLALGRSPVRSMSQQHLVMGIQVFGALATTMYLSTGFLSSVVLQRASLGAGAKGCAKPRGPTVQAISCGLLTCRPGTPLDDPVARITSSPYFLGLFKVTISYPRELFFCRGIRR